MKSKFIQLVSLLFLMGTIQVQAAEGDTTNVIVMQDGLWDWYGNLYSTGTFPTDQSYRKVTFKYILGCPTGGCSDWDYSTSIYLRHNTGEIDSSLVDYPSFTANGNSPDTLFISNSPTYTLSASNGNVDSTLNSLEIVHFDNSTTPGEVIDTTNAYSANFWQMVFDGSGNLVDSMWIAADDTLILEITSVYETFDVIQEYEVARVITPYGGYWSDPREHVYEYDLTDYQHLLKGDVEFRAFYGGWSAGWNLNLEVEMIEGTAPRNCYNITQLWEGDFKYGVTSDPIEDHLTTIKKYIADTVDAVRLKGLITGHSFGGNENCAEFCSKTHQFIANEVYSYDQLVWRDDCGENPVYPQNGTWLYDRGGWCPGALVNWHEYELTDIYTAGDSLQLDYQMDSYTYNGGASFDPSYRIATYLYEYSAPNFNLDAEVSEIIAPSTKDHFQRKNPICGNPIVRIKNAGNTDITSLTITYGIEGQAMQTFNWTGSLSFLEEEDVTLPPVDALSTQTEDATFVVSVSEPNGSSDEYDQNNQMKSTFELVETLPGDFVVWFKTNNAYWETSYSIVDIDGNVVYENQSNLAANTIYKDTIALPIGCYQLVVEDSGEDGSAWWANNDGSGYVQIRQANGSPAVIKSFNSDYGTGFMYYFTVDQAGSVQKIDPSLFSVALYPNPAVNQVQIEMVFNEATPVKIEVIDMAGRIIMNKSIQTMNAHTEFIDVANWAKGAYQVKVTSDQQFVTRTLIVE